MAVGETMLLCGVLSCHAMVYHRCSDADTSLCLYLYSAFPIHASVAIHLYRLVGMRAMVGFIARSDMGVYL